MCIYSNLYIINIYIQIYIYNQIWLSSTLSPLSSSPSFSPLSSSSSLPSISSPFSTSYEESQVTTLPCLSTILPCSMESLPIQKDSLSNPYSFSSDLFQSLSKSPSKMILTTCSTFISSLPLLQS